MPKHENLSLAGKTAVVTGAGRGLGAHVAQGLAAHGARVVVIARSEPQVEQTTRAIRDAGGQAIGIAADVGDAAAVDKIRERVKAEFGPVTILINAAGVFGPYQPIVASDPRRWIETLLTNVAGPYLTCRAWAPDMIAAGWGRIVNFSSAASLYPPTPLNSAYATSKVALNHFTRQLAQELSGTGVTANAIHPGEVKTAMWAAVRDESAAAGPEGEGHRRWAAHVGQSGGDDPQLALNLILDLLADPDPTRTGKFLWIEGGLQPPIPSWD